MKSSNRKLHTTAGSASILALALLGGCSGSGFGFGARNLTMTSQALESTPFVAPFDPAMGTIVVAVPEVTLSAPGCGIGDVAQAVRSQFTSALSSSANFLVADRESLGDINREYELARIGATSPQDRPVIGQLAAPRLLLRVDVTEFQENVVGESRNSKFEAGGILGFIGGFIPGVGGQIVRGVGVANPTVGGGRQTVQGVVGMEVRVIDVDTGAVSFATQARGLLTQENRSTIFGIAGLSTSGDQFAHSVIAHATRAAAQDAVIKIHAALRSRVALASAGK